MGRALRRRLFVGTILLLVVSVSASSLWVTTGIASAGIWDGRKDHRGYFDNDFGHSESPYSCAGHVASGPVIDNGCYTRNSLPTSVDSADELYNFLKETYDGGSRWDKTGSSFIVNTLLGRKANSGQKDRSLDNSEWSALRTALNNPNLSFKKERVSSATYGGIDTFYQYKQNDVAYYKDSESGDALVIRAHGQVVYVLMYKCANPVGDLEGLPDCTVGSTCGGGGQQEDWTVGTSISTDTTTVNAGDTITFHHGIYQNGPLATDRSVIYGYRTIGDGGSGVTGTYPVGTLPAKTPKGKSVGYDTQYVTTYDDAGRQICRQSYGFPHAAGSGITISNVVCVNVAASYKYDLHPRMTIDSADLSRTVTAGDTVNFYHSILNDGPSASKPTNKWMTRCEYAPGQAYATANGETDNTLTAPQTFGNGADCTATPLNSRYDTYTFQKGWTTYDPTLEDTSNLSVGAHVCYILSVRPPNPTADAATWRHSPPACISVLKIPTIHALGGDVRAGSVITSALRNFNGRAYGSWAEYGIFGVGGITGMSSSAGLARGAVVTADAKLHALTLANVPSKGNYYSSTPATDDYTVFSAHATGTTGSTARGGPIGPADAHAIIHVQGDLRITGDMTYAGTYGSLAAVSRVIYVVDGNITVDAGVTRIDPWLISKGTLYTCSDYTRPDAQKLSTGKCSAPLVFNGPVTATTIVLGRTAGADAATGDRDRAAETFTLTPTNFLSGYSASVSASNIQTVYEKELPPRY